jgi:hypothetical protein
MNPIAALHDAARRYCQDHAAEWVRRYSETPENERRVRTSGPYGWTYSDRAYDLFPRYNVLGAILHEVERFVPEEFSSVEELREILAATGETARSEFTNGTNPVEAAAMQEERQRFAAFVRTVQPHASDLLPYRRVLGTAEAHELWRQFVAQWGTWCGGDVERDDLPPFVTLHVAAMDHPGAYGQLRQALAGRGISRVIELREGGGGYEIDPALASFAYDGPEGFWTADVMDWMVYASHESSITFGGEWLIERMRAALPEFDRYRYKGYDLSLYGNG